MRTKSYAEAAAFLADTERDLAAHEAANSLILGLCGRLARDPRAFGEPPLIKTFADERGLLLVAMLTPPQNLLVYGLREDAGGAARLLLDELLEADWPLPGVLGPAPLARQVAEAWTAATGRPHRGGSRQWLQELRRVLVPPPERGRLRAAVQADTELVARWWAAFHQELFGRADREESRKKAAARIERGDISLWQDGAPVSIAMRTRPTRRGTSLSLVYTPAERRGRGYATACVGELSRLLLQEGRQFCTLFVDVDNAPANRVYEKVGYRPLCVHEEYIFLGGEK